VSDPLDPLAAHAHGLQAFWRAHVPPDADGARTDEIGNAEVAPGPGVTIRADYGVPPSPPSCTIRGGDQRTPEHRQIAGRDTTVED